MTEKTGQTRGNWRIRFIGAVMVVTGAVAGGTIAALVKQDTAGPAAIVVVNVDRGEVTLEVATTGTVEPATTHTLSFAVAGTVESVKVRAGDRVDRGQILAVLEDTEAADDVNDARDSLAAAQSRLGRARDVMARATAAATACVDPGDSRPIVAAADPCPTPGFPGDGTDPVLTAQQQVNRAARAVEKAEKALVGTSLTAPVAGTVVAVEGKVGDRIRSGSTFISVADTRNMRVRAAFPEADAGALTAGQAATVTPAGSDVRYDAEVVQVDPVGTSDGTLVRYGALLAFADSPDDLLVGQRAQVKVRTGAVDSVLRVPSTAVHDVSEGSGTVLVHDGRRPVERVVAVGLRGDRYTEITDGLEHGDQVVRSW